MPSLFLYLIVGFGGFGIFRVIIRPHDSVGLIAILASFVCLTIFRRASRKAPARSSHNAPFKKPISLKRVASNTFTFFPGVASGYAGYTDYNAMRARLNDDLMLRPPKDQFALLGFGIGFLSALGARITAEEMLDVQCDGASESEAQLLGWLAYIQDVGTDNADPSTRNLRDAIQSFATQVNEKGPVTMDYWRKVHDGLDESLDTSGIANGLMDELRSTFSIEYKNAERFIMNADITERQLHPLRFQF